MADAGVFVRLKRFSRVLSFLVCKIRVFYEKKINFFHDVIF